MGIGNFPDVLSKVTDANRVSEQLYARCKAIMYELDDFSLAETYADATNAIERLGGPVEARPNAIFMKFVEKNHMSINRVSEILEKIQKKFGIYMQLH